MVMCLIGMGLSAYTTVALHSDSACLILGKLPVLLYKITNYTRGILHMKLLFHFLFHTFFKFILSLLCLCDHGIKRSLFHRVQFLHPAL